MRSGSEFPKYGGTAHALVGYSESHPDLIDDARRWLTQTHDEPVLSVLIFCFKKPSQASEFADFSKWKAFVEVYER
jgi:hypothetical protein